MKRLLTWVVISAALVSGCGGSGGSGGRGTVEVLQGDAAIEASLQAAVTLAAVLATLLGEPVADLGAPGSPSASAAAISDASTAGVAARAVRIACPLGGSVDGDCREDRGRTILTTRSSNCVIRDPSNRFDITANGRADATFESLGICGRATTPDDVPVTVELRGYREEWRQGASVVREIESRRLTNIQRPQAGGCSNNQGQLNFDGDVTLRGADYHWKLHMRSVEVDVSSAGSPCDEISLITGEIDVSDEIRGTRFIAELAGVRHMSFRGSSGDFEVALDGQVNFDCTGAVRIATERRLILSGSCPIDGEIELERDGNARSLASFSRDGIRLDYDGDGVADLQSPGCAAEVLEACM